MYYSKSHEWIVEEGGKGRVGLTKNAQKEFGEIVYIAFPKVGQKVIAGEEVAVIESTKAAVDLYSPVSGIIEKVNTKLIDHPGLINSSPEKEGWIFELSLTHPQELKHLLLAPYVTS